MKTSKWIAQSLLIISLFFYACSSMERGSDYTDDSDAEVTEEAVEEAAVESAEEAPTESAKRTKKEKAEEVISIVADDIADEADMELSDETETVLVEEEPAAENTTSDAGLLTAGEWNDLKHWDFWKKLIASEDWLRMPTLWNFKPTIRVGIVVKNSKGEMLKDVTAKLKNEKGVVVWQAQTDNFGKAELWANLFEKNAKSMSLVLQTADGKTKTIAKINTTKSMHEITMEAAVQKTNKLDLMFVVDATGSMSDELEFLKTELDDIIQKVNNKTNKLKTRVGMVFYRDHEDDYVIRDFAFETTISKVLANLNKQYAGGGGDFPEAVDEALVNAIESKVWSKGNTAKILFLILDAPPHNNDASKQRMQKASKMAAMKGIKIMPIVASGINKETEFLMRFVAMATNGTYIFLTDDSGVGESHLEPTVGSYQVEMLNNLMVRLIMKELN